MSETVRSAIFVIVGIVIGGVVVVLAIAGGLIDFGPRKGVKESWGSFSGAPRLELLEDGRKAELLNDFAYIDPRNKAWVAPKGAIVDGASIPRSLWSIVGAPWEGQYRNASIVHDEGCNRKTDSWQDVHLMFYEACRCGGVPETRAKLLYAAVYHFGPRWIRKAVMMTSTHTAPDGSIITEDVARTIEQSVQMPEMSDADIQKLREFIDGKNPSLEAIRGLISNGSQS